MGRAELGALRMHQLEEVLLRAVMVQLCCSAHHMQPEGKGEMETCVDPRELPSHFTSRHEVPVTLELLLNMFSYMLNRNEVYIKVKSSVVLAQYRNTVGIQKMC